MISKFYISILTVVVLTGCFGTEEAVQPFPRGEVSTQNVAMGAKYGDQFFYSLDQNQIVAQVKKTAWDLAYSCTKENFTIRLNTGKNMRVAQTAATNFGDISDTSGLEFKWDWSNGKDDSTALFGWENAVHIYVVNMGTDADNNHLGFYKVRFTAEGEDLGIEYAELGDIEIKKYTLIKEEQFNNVYFSFDSEIQVQIEPKKDDYSLIFSQYIYYFAPEDLAYLVVGTLTNSNETKVARVFDKDFSEVSLSDTIDHPFNSNADAIGYDWKEFILAEGVYVVYANQNYVIRDSKGFYYKLHFTDFYSETGERGYPKLEYKRL